MSVGPPLRLVLRDAAQDDLEALVALETQAFRSDRMSRRQFRYHLRRARNRLVVAVSQGHTAGYILLLRRGALARIYSLAVDSACRGQGIGRALCEHAEQTATAWDVRAVRLEVRTDNPPARAMYERLGYRIIQRLPGYYADHGDGLRLEKAL